MKLKINKRGYWENNSTEGHGSDPKLAQGIVNHLKSVGCRDVVDIGCGDGFYTRFLLAQGLPCEGYDGNPYTERITEGLCKVADFSKPVELKKYDWVLSLEVGEHIPRKYENIFINNLVNTALEGIIVSWSIPEYGGEGHVNPQPNEYIKEKFKKLGFENELESEWYLRSKPNKYPDPCYWFSKTLMVFRKV